MSELLIGLLSGFLAGALVFRNNSSAFNKVIDPVEKVVEDIKK